MSGTRPDRRMSRRAASTSALLLIGGLALTGCSAVSGATEFVTELTGGEVSKKVVDADGTEYIILKGQPMGESVGGADGNYRRNLQFPEGLSTEVQQWSELDAGGFYAQLKEAGMVGSAVSDEEAGDVANAVARATTSMHRVLVDTPWLDVNVTDGAIRDLMPVGEVPDDSVDDILERTLRGWNPDSTEQEFALPPLIHDGWNRFAQHVDEDGEAVAPLGDFTVEKTPERCARCYTVTFHEVKYLFRASPETFEQYAEWMQEHFPQSVSEDTATPFADDGGVETATTLINYTGDYEMFVQANDDWASGESDSYHYANGWWLYGAGFNVTYSSIPVRDE